MATITVTGEMRMPRHIREKLAELTTIKECAERQQELRRRVQGAQEEIDDAQREKNEAEEEQYWLKYRFEQIIAENPAEAEEWAYLQAIRNPNQQKLNLAAAV